MTRATTLAATAVAARKDGFQFLATATRASAVATLTRARTATAIGEPTRGITTNGIANVAVIAPSVFAASSLPALEATRAGSSSRSADEAGNVKPMTIVVGRTTRSTGPTIAIADSRTRLGSSGPGWPMTRTRLENASAATTTWATAMAPTGRPMRDRSAVNTAAPIAIPIRNVPRISVKT